MEKQQKNLLQESSFFEIFLASRKINFKTIMALIITSVSTLMTLYYFMTAYYGAPTGILHRFLFLFFILILSFLLFPLKRKLWSSKINVFFFIDVILLILTMVVAVYVLNDIQGWQMRFYRPSPTDTIIGIIGIFLVIEATRRTIGIAMVFVTAFFIIHTLFANYFPSFLYTAPTSLKRLVDVLFNVVGIFSMPLQAMASYVILFLLFGTLLVRSGAGKFFINMAYSISGRLTGGPAKTAVLSSALFGSISGSSVANVVTTGSFTIPLMKSTGYSALSAGAIEAVASTGGNFMPPIMGAVAFIMAQYLGIPYIKIIIYGTIPAILYFFSLIMMVHFEAKKQDVKSLPKAELPSLKDTFIKGGHLLLAIVILVIFLIRGYTATMAAFWGILITFILSFFRKETQLNPVRLISAIEEASRKAIIVGMACACAGIIIGCLYSSGLGIRLTGIIVQAAGGRLWLALIYTMFTSLLLGMGMTSVGVYLILVIVVTPALVEMGVKPIAAHMFAFYFGVISNITPPVCVAAFAAAAISGASPMRTGFKAFQMGIASYIIPFMFVYNPSILMIGKAHNVLLSAIIGLLGVAFLASSTVGWLFNKLSTIERIILLASAVLLIVPKLEVGILGFAMGSVVIYMQKKAFEKRKNLLKK